MFDRQAVSPAGYLCECSIGQVGAVSPDRGYQYTLNDSSHAPGRRVNPSNESSWFPGRCVNPSNDSSLTILTKCRYHLKNRPEIFTMEVIN